MDPDVFQLIGQSLHGKYRIDSLVGEGGFGLVYRGFHLNFEQPIAVKCLKIPGHFTADARRLFLDRFRTEGKHLAQLSQHGSITRVYDFSVASGADGIAIPYLVLEWLDGSELAQLLSERRAQRRPFAEAEAAALLRPAIEALAFAHQLGIAHRDVKPENLMLANTARGPVLKVLDFGIAKVMQDGDTASRKATKTSSGFRAFSPGYGAPEQFNSQRFGATGPWTDVHALALILSEMVSGRHALPLHDAAELVRRATNDPRPTPRALGARVSDAFEQLCARALALEAAARFADARGMLEQLDALPQAESSPAAAPASETEVITAAKAVTLPEVPLTQAQQPLPSPTIQQAPATEVRSRAVQRPPSAPAVPAVPAKRKRRTRLLVIAIPLMVLSLVVVSALLLWPGGEEPAADAHTSGDGTATAASDYEPPEVVLTSAQVQQVVRTNRAAAARDCSDHAPGGTSSKTSLMVTIEPSGDVGRIASSDDSSLARCLKKQVASWKFPPSDEATTFSLPFSVSNTSSPQPPPQPLIRSPFDEAPAAGKRKKRRRVAR